MKAGGLAVAQEDCCSNIAITLIDLSKRFDFQPAAKALNLRPGFPSSPQDEVRTSDGRSS